MPNCDFYGLEDDLLELLQFVFAQPGWTLIELASEHEKPLREFRALPELQNAFPRILEMSRAEHFQLWSPEMGARWEARRIDFNPGLGARFRYDCEGWGLIQLYLGRVSDGELSSCHTNHNSATRAKNWEPTIRELGATDEWDFKAVSRMSSRLNRFIHKRSVAKWGSRPILPAAQDAFALGKLTRGM